MKVNENHQAMVLRKIAETWRKYPELRLGQLLENTKRTRVTRDLFYVNDMELVVALESLDSILANQNSGENKK